MNGWMIKKLDDVQYVTYTLIVTFALEGTSIFADGKFKSYCLFVWVFFPPKPLVINI